MASGKAGDRFSGWYVSFLCHLNASTQLYFTMASSILLLLLASVAASQNTCYYPDGSVPELDEGTFVPCPGTQSCCVSGDTCLNDGQCFSHTLPAVYVGACQVQNWAQATSCASFQSALAKVIYPVGRC